MLSEPVLRNLFTFALTGTLFALFGLFAYRPSFGAGDWKRVEPGPGYWIVFVITACVFVLITLIRVSYDPSWPDADRQIAALNWILVALGTATALCGYSIARIKRLAVQWRGTWLSYRNADGNRIVRDFLELVSVRKNALGYFVLRFEDGDVLRLDPFARGTDRMIRDIGEFVSGLLQRSESSI